MKQSSNLKDANKNEISHQKVMAGFLTACQSYLALLTCLRVSCVVDMIQKLYLILL